MEIRATAWNDALQLATGDISRGGLFIRSDEPLNPGDQLTVRLDLPDGSRLEVGGEVAHCISPERAAAEQIAAGFGVRFDDKHAIDLDLLGAIAASNSAGEGRLDTSYVSLPALLLDHQGGRQVITSAHHLVERDAGLADDGIDIVVDGMLDEAELGASAARPHARGADAATADPDELIFGLDFGTSYSSIALVQGNAVQVFCGDDGHNQIPSTVAYLDSGPPLVGWAAREQLALSPATTIPSPKRLIGRQYDDPKVDPFLGATPVRFQRGPGGTIVAELFGEIVAMPQICACLFDHLLQLVREGAGLPVRRAVLSAPVGLQRERASIQRAAELAGIEVLQILDEPVAAALAYGLDLTGDQTIAVYDFGGGTFDVSLLRVRGGGGVTVIGTTGDPWLGGDDLDLALANHVADAFWKHKKIDLRERKVEWQRLLFACEMTKIKLSVEREVEIYVPAVALTLSGPVDLRVAVSRDLLHHACHAHVERSIDIVEECLGVVGVSPAQIDHVVLTGGTSRSPQVRARLQQYFGRELSLTIDPDLAVVTGNALYGRYLARHASAQA